MTTSATGKVIDETGIGLPNLTVVLDDVSQLHEVRLGKSTTNTQGDFSLTYSDFLAVNEPGKQARQLRLSIRLGEHILKQIPQSEPTGQSQLAFGSITIAKVEATGWWATRGTGAPARLTQGNALRWLVDNEDAWGRVEDVIAGATTLDVMQLQIDVDKFKTKPEDEEPRIVLRFDTAPQPLNAVTRRPMDPDDKRIERSLLARAVNGVDVRIQLPRMRIDRKALLTIGTVAGIASLIAISGIIGSLIATIALGALAGLLFAGIGLLLLWVERKKLSNQFHRRELARWFEQGLANAASRQPPPAALGKVRVGELIARSNSVTHTKLVIDRNKEAVLLGSPFEQKYFDDATHALDDPRRGEDASKGPIHDVSVSVRGPSVWHMQELFNSHWNAAEAGDQITLPSQPPGAATPTTPDEFACSVQVVRTLDQKFAPDTNGETTVLEAYLRAIHLAERFIYCENQYFNNDRITDALIAALAAKPNLKVILLLNPAPDMPLYLGWQQEAIRRIRDSLGPPAAASTRFGVFSTWTHASSQQTGGTKPTLVDNYLHTKSALVDNRWATVGSANLDGASLDFVQYARPLLDGDVRNTETNVVVFEEVPLNPSPVDALRRRLWSEHLGCASPAATELADTPGKDWLAVWNTRAATKRDGLLSNLDQVSPIRILPWPTAAFEANLGFTDRFGQHVAGKRYLQHLFSPDEVASDVLVSQYDVLGKSGPPGFKFRYGSGS